MSDQTNRNQNNEINLSSFVQNTLIGDNISEEPLALIRINVQLQEFGYLIPGEEVKKIIVKVRVNLVGGAFSTDNSGILIITNFKILLLNGHSKEDKNILHSVPMGTILRIKEKKKSKIVLEVYCKDGRFILLNFNSVKDRPAVVDAITKYAFPSSCHQLFAFVHKMFISNDNSSNKLETPIYFDTERDYVRQGVYNQKNLRYSLANSDFSLCSTYPKLLIVLSTITDQELKEIGLFRSKGRIPAIVWFHPKKKSLLVRCAQPCVGINRTKSFIDEKYLSEFKMAGQEKLYIVDSRPKANAVANMLRGGGYESPKVYKDIEIEFSDIENIHVIRNSLNAVFKACQNATPLQLTQLETEINESKWFLHIRLILASVIRVVSLLHDHGYSVLVHCSDGWDRTSQTTATCELLMDTYYRRIEGFIVLIEREWLQFGHQFALRYGHGENMVNYKESQRSPIFPQWIDLVWQLLVIYPKFFEFNERLLFFILEELYSCRYGTFLFNTVKERMENSVYSNTISCWEYVLQNKELFKNQNYVEKKGVLIPNLSNIRLRLWSSLYMQYKDDRLRQSVIYEIVDQLNENKPNESDNNNNNNNNYNNNNDDLIINTVQHMEATKAKQTKSINNLTLRSNPKKNQIYQRRRKSGSFVLDKGQSILPQNGDGSFVPPSEEIIDQRLENLFNKPKQRVIVESNNNNNTTKLTRSTSSGDINDEINNKSDIEQLKDIIADHNKHTEEENNNNHNNILDNSNNEDKRPMITSSIIASNNAGRSAKTNSTIFKEMLSDDSMSRKDKRKARLVTPSIVNNLNQESNQQRLQRANSYDRLTPNANIDNNNEDTETKKRHNSQLPAANAAIIPKKKYVHQSDCTEYRESNS